MIEGLKPVRHEYRTHAQDSWYACTERQYRECEPMLGVGVGGGFRALYAEEQVRQLAEQRAELLGAMNRAFDLIASIGYPANTSGRYDKSGKWTFDEAIPDHTNASAIESAFDVIADAIANATQQRNATGGEG